MPFGLAIVVFWIFTCFLARGQTVGVSGTVSDDSGGALVGARVYGEQSCCTYGSDSATTDEAGHFELAHPGSVLHARYPGFQPFAIVLKGENKEVKIQLRPESEKFRLSKCQSPSQGEQWLGTKDIQFRVPERGVRISRIQDIDYVEYRIRVKRKGIALELWFGSTAFNPGPDDKLLISSSEFSQKNIYGPDGDLFAMDSRGQTIAGAWRHTGGVTEGATYSNASPQESAVFDRIIDSRCVPGIDEKRQD